MLTEHSSLTLTHSTGISFALTLNEALELVKFIEAQHLSILTPPDKAKIEETDSLEEENSCDKNS